jgi:hypothetical protein
MNLIFAKQDKDDKLIKRILWKNKQTYTNHIVNDIELFSLSMNLIFAKQDKDDKLIKRILWKNKQTYTNHIVNDTDVLLENGKVFTPKGLHKYILD